MHRCDFIRHLKIASNGHRSKLVNLSQVLMGDRIKTADYDISMKENVNCKSLCSVTLTTDHTKTLMKRIEQEYAVRLNLDNMPVVIEGETRAHRPAYRFGYDIRYMKDGKGCIHNHLKFKVLYNDPKSSDTHAFNAFADIDTDTSSGFRVVGFEVETYSVDHKLGADGKPTNETCPVSNSLAPIAGIL